MTPRATWKGVLQISLVRIPIKVYPATSESESIRFNQLHDACTTRITQRRWCVSCAREVPSAEIVKGYEFAVGKYVILQDEELDAVAPESTHTIHVTQFVRPAAVELRMIDRAYYLAPDGADAALAYALLGSAMQGYLGIGTLALYGREYVVAVDPFRGSLLLYTLHPAAEWREAPYVADPVRVTGTDVSQATRLVTAMAGPLNLSTFTDQYQTDLRRLIDAKIAGEEIVEPPVVASVPVLALKDALTQSLALAKAPAKRARAS